MASDDDRPTWFLHAGGKPVSAASKGGDKAPPAWVCREGDAAWTRVEAARAKGEAK